MQNNHIYISALWFSKNPSNCMFKNIQYSVKICKKTVCQGLFYKNCLVILDVCAWVTRMLKG